MSATSKPQSPHLKKTFEYANASVAFQISEAQLADSEEEP
jgi:hypothetical protein